MHDTLSPPARDDGSIAYAIRAQRTGIAQAMLESAVRRQEVTVGAELLARSFIDRFADAVETGAWPAFFEWIDRTCDKHAGALPIVRLLTLAMASIAASLDAAAARDPRIDFAAIADRVRTIAERPRVARLAVPHQSLNEVDVALDRLMSRLTNFDPATADHSRAVAMWCARIGKKMSLSASETTLVTRSGLIHDIGKVTTPHEILGAPHRLNDADMAIMRQHAAAGAAIISEIPLLAHLTPAVRSHHERLDGEGYPDGRVGSEIPIVVRIVSVADSFNAMIGNRPYRLPMAPTLALEQLRQHCGTQFDANVVAAMIEVVGTQR